jgi:hypothetical protein
VIFDLLYFFNKKKIVIVKKKHIITISAKSIQIIALEQNPFITLVIFVHRIPHEITTQSIENNSNKDCENR